MTWIPPALLLAVLLAAPPAEVPGNGTNPDAVREVLAGRLAEANASWWGFDEHDATDALQAAIRSGARKVVVPDMGADWVVRPIQLAGDQELVLEPGVVVTALRGAYQGGGDTVFTASGVDNLTIRGEGATIRMHKEDYIVGLVLRDLGWERWFGPYTKAEWRTTLAIRGCDNVTVTGLTLRDSGGDGMYIDGGGPRRASSRVTIRGVLCENHYRQGMSVISVDGLRVEDSSFRNTWGTPPSAGVDIEPDSPDQMIKDVVFRNCRFEDNYGDGIEVFLAHLNRASGDVSIRFEECRVSSRLGSGIRVTRINDDGPGGSIVFRNCLVENTEAYGITVQTKSADAARVVFERCKVRNVARDRNYHGPWAPIWLRPNEPDKVKRFGGVSFLDCVVEDRHDRPLLLVPEEYRVNGVHDLAGTIHAVSGAKTLVALGDKAEGVSLRARDARPLKPDGLVVEHVKAYYAPGRFGGWPANHGIWSWGDEILVGLSAGYMKDNGPDRHAIDHAKPEEHLLARSLDGGRTWSIENPAEKGALIPVGASLHGITPPGLVEKPWRDVPDGIDFTHPDFAMTVRMTDVHASPARFYTSTDRGRNWDGPFRLPLFGQAGIAARTDYVVLGKHECLLFLTAPKSDGREGRPLCVRTVDGGKTWEFLSWIGPEPGPGGYAIMPSTISLGDGHLLSAIRRKQGPRHWIETYRSRDGGRSWQADGLPAPDAGEGNPPSLIRLADGRVCLTYGFRAAPYAMRARLSADGGQTWGPEVVLRDDGGGRDLGYPRSVQRPDGKVVTAYYFWDRQTGAERYIAATIWDPDRAR